MISGNAADGITIYNATADVVEGNFIGTNAAGTAAIGNLGDGVNLDLASFTTVGGTSPGAGNLISGNVNGVEMNDSSTTLVQGNLIGTDATGSFALANTHAGVWIYAGSTSNTVGGAVGGGRNVISGNAAGVLIAGGTTAGTLVAGNLIGTDQTGSNSVGNVSAGIQVTGGSSTTIGGTTTLARNVVSGNAADGIDVSGGPTGTLLVGDYVGMDQTGTKGLGNAANGISVSATAGVTIGGTAQGAAMIISGNAGSGLSITSASGTSVVVLGDFIGTDNSGSTPIGNGLYGILLTGSTGVVVGGTAAGDRNIISGNTGVGIGLYGGTTGTAIEGNLIGTDITGSQPLGNGTGIRIDGAGSSNNTIGGTVALAGNTIAYSNGTVAGTGIGVEVDATAGTGNMIRLNSIFSNHGLGIDLGGDGPTSNDSAGHTGPNQYQNFPAITSVTINNNGTTTVGGTLSSMADTSFALDFFTLSSNSASGYGEGRYVLGSGAVAVGPTGTATFTFTFSTPANGAEFVTATATDPSGNTSEFSLASGMDQPPTAKIAFTTLTVDEGVSIPFDGSGSIDPNNGSLTYAWTFGDGATASGARPYHAFTSPGIEHVTLTVDDGFGGESTASATVTVSDVPPIFTPDSYTPPETFSSSTHGDGFGTAVAAVNGNVAIGAPQAGPVARSIFTMVCPPTTVCRRLMHTAR